MPRKNSLNFKSGLLVFLLQFAIFWKCCDAQVNREESTTPPYEHGGDGSAFFALRSCHQLLHGDSGEFFSPDYLCSNPSLWCNWTIQVDVGKRINLHLEDLTPDDSCHLKKDQIHVDEPTGHLVGHKVLQKCWREAKYTSSSNTLYVVLLIGGWPSPPYRGFYGRYQAFGPPVVYNPQEGFTVRSSDSEPSTAHMDTGEFETVMNSEVTEPTNSDLTYDYSDQRNQELEQAADNEVGENLHLPSENYSHVYQFTAEPTAPPSRTLRSGRGVPHQASRSETAAHPAHPQPSDELKTSTPTAIRRNVEAAEESRTHRRLEEKSADGSEEAEEEEDENRMDVFEQLPSPSEGSEPQHTEQSHPQPNMVEPLSDHRGLFNMRNHSDSSHLPGDHLFEIAVELNFSQDLEESWDSEARSLLLSVKNMISKQLDILHTPLSISSKRIKRLNAGVLYILWLQIGQEPGGLQVHRVIHSALQSIIAAGVGLRGNHRKAVILSVSTADVNECGTQLVLCDINADCVNQFGSYSCHCRPGFQDESRLGSGGTSCVDVKAAGCSSGLSSEAKGVYVLFFLLSSLILLLLVAAGMLYRRHHQGSFLVRCHSSSSISSPDHNNNHHHHPDDGYSSPTDCDLPPPPPPVRGPREGWGQVKGHGPAVDLPLLRFSSLLPPETYIDPQEGEKM